ncbi:MAG: HEPN domain-containing protein [Dehalococcoidales bacterium]|nr:HEPN domain-containing protein [Dehalococcoidales bacterium]
MNQEFKQCLENKKVVSFTRGKNLVKKELSAAKSDLLDARSGYENERYKWSTIQGYYAMFHAARALVYSRGYREKSHYYLAVALRALFVDEGIMDAQLVRDFLNAMNLREAADYEAEFSQSGAKAVIASAEKFIVKAAAILGVSEYSL